MSDSHARYHRALAAWVVETLGTAALGAATAFVVAALIATAVDADHAVVLGVGSVCAWAAFGLVCVFRAPPEADAADLR